MTVTDTGETGHITGTKDKDYNIIWFTEQCLSNALRLEIYIQDAERAGDSELADFFRRAQTESRKGAEQGKKLLRPRASKARPRGQSSTAKGLVSEVFRRFRARTPRLRAIARAIRAEVRRIAGSWPESGSQKPLK